MNPRETFDPNRDNADDDPLDDRGLGEPSPTDVRTAGTTQVLAGDDEALGRPGVTNTSASTSSTDPGGGTLNGSPVTSSDVDER
jgi:hypothetical protein